MTDLAVAGPALTFLFLFEFLLEYVWPLLSSHSFSHGHGSNLTWAKSCWVRGRSPGALTSSPVPGVGTKCRRPPTLRLE